jgi:comEA protein
MSYWTDPLRGLRFSIIVVSLAFLVGGVIHRQDFFRPVELMAGADSAQTAEFQRLANLPSDSVWIKININTDIARHLEALPGIGPVKAKTIVDYRVEHGFYRSPEELLNIQGIGPKTLDKIKPLITLDTTGVDYQTLTNE